MERRPLFHANLNVSVICLGTMTWGEQNSEADAHAQLNFAMQHGINFVDTAEMYPVPPRAETGTRTESILGSWLAIPGNREKIVLASKVAGPGRYDWLREETKLSKKTILAACDASLKRLRTDYIDLYQIHWPDRNVAAFGSWQFNPALEREYVSFAEQIEAMQELIKAGKIRGYGLSNETAWGTTMFCRVAEQLNAPKPASIQNAYSLVNRTFEGDLAETSYREQVPLLAYSPLAMGALTGKYDRGAMPRGSRFERFREFGGRYRRPLAMLASEEYGALAKKIGMTPVELALAFVVNKWFVASAIIGATSVQQLQQIYNAHYAKLPEEASAQIESISARYLHPAA
jgi:aryl-alcohol dehydrogenase-like predicted oxidoreductase